MELIQYHAGLKVQWDKVVSESKNGNFLHSRDYMEYHADRFDDRSVLLVSRGEPVAVFPCNEQDATIISHGGLTYGGLLFGVDVHAPDVMRMFSEIGGYFKSVGCRKIIYKPTPHVFHKYPSEEDLYALVRMGARLYRRDLSSVVELAGRPKWSDSRKSTARKSEKAGVQIAEMEGFSEFHALLSSVLEKFGTTPVHSEAELRLLKSRFPKQIRLFGAYLEGSLLATALVYDFGHIVHTQYLATSERGKELGALDFLLIGLIGNIFTAKSYFSFGISTEDQGRYLNEGLIRQKEGFGARGVVHDFYEWDL